MPAQLSSAHGVRAGRDDLVCGARSNCCEPGQKGGIRHVFGPLRAATIPYKLSETHNALYARSMRRSREGEIHPIAERLCRGASLKEGELPALGYMGDQPAPGMLRLGDTRPAEPANRRVGILPMRNGSGHEEAPQDESANSCMSNIRHLAPINER